MTAKW